MTYRHPHDLKPIHGAAVGLRSCHYQYILEHRPAIAWLEVLIDNYMVKGGMMLHRLQQIREHYSITFHGVGMSLGSTDPLNMNYLQHLKALADRFAPSFISDHLCWGSVNHQYLHELLPLPYTEEALKHVVKRINTIQDYLGQRILIEDVSSYLTYNTSTLCEWEFLNAVAEQADCYILLDINNVYVSAYNHGFDAKNYLSKITRARVKQFHLAGFEDHQHYYLDAHSACVKPPVWALFDEAIQRFGAQPTAIEWDNNIPDFPLLAAQAQQAELLLSRHSL